MLLRRSFPAALAFALVALSAGCSGGAHAVPSVSLSNSSSATTSTRGANDAHNGNPACPPTQNDPFCATPPPNASETAVGVIKPKSGGSVTVADGSGVVITGSAVSKPTVIRVSTIPAPQETPSSPNFAPLGPALRIDVRPIGDGRPPQRTTTAGARSITIRLKIPADVASRFVAAKAARTRSVTGGQAEPDFLAPILRIYQLDSPQRYIDVTPQAFSYDPNLALAIVTIFDPLSGTLLDTAGQIEFFVAEYTHASTPCGLRGIFTPGLRYYDPTSQSWVKGAPPTTEPRHALLLLHGITSCVEETFSSGQIERYRADGAYDYVIGYDYDWLDDPKSISDAIAGAVNGLGLTKIDIFAHSYGTINAIATVPKLNVRQIDNLVLYDGPLDGALIADANVYASLLTNSLKLSFPLDVPPALFTLGLQQATKIFQPGNADLQQLEQALQSSGAVAHVVKISGGTPLLLANNNLTMQDIYTKLTGIVPSENDGIVTTESATFSVVQGVQPPATLDSRDTIDALTSGHIIAEADHRTILSPSVDAKTGRTFEGENERLISPDLSFEFDNSFTDSGLFPDSGAAVVMKGARTRVHIYLTDACFASAFQVFSFTDPTYVNYDPMSSLAVTNCGTTTPFTFTVTSDPPTAVAIANGVAKPTSSAVFLATDPYGDYVPLFSDFFVLPKCTSCVTSGQSPLDLRKRSQRAVRSASRAGSATLRSSRPIHG